VFVHGYFVSFDDAILRTAQIATDIGFDGAPIVYDWPSHATVEDYVADKTSITDSIQNLVEFLQNIAALSGATTVNLIAHSMGNYGLLTALDNLAMTQKLPSFNQLVLAAPDIDVVRIRQIIPRLVASKRIGRITLYASEHDLPLKASAKVNRVAPAGQTPPALVISGVDTIDASAVESSFLGHDYFAATRAVLGDIWTLFGNGSPPPRFGMDKVVTADGVYWKISRIAF
jgi:esterase/lipase superfamily enzyme